MDKEELEKLIYELHKQYNMIFKNVNIDYIDGKIIIEGNKGQLTLK